MDSTPPRPHHPSYLRHRSQTAWQIIVPVVVAGLVMIGVIVLVWSATFRGNGDVARWAAISTIWLVLPVMLGGLLVLVALAGVAYLLGRLTGLIPPYSYLAQAYAARVEAGVKEAADAARQPRRLVGTLGSLLKRAFKLGAGTVMKRFR